MDNRSAKKNRLQNWHIPWKQWPAVLPSLDTNCKQCLTDGISSSWTYNARCKVNDLFCKRITQTRLQRKITQIISTRKSHKQTCFQGRGGLMYGLSNLCSSCSGCWSIFYWELGERELFFLSVKQATIIFVVSIRSKQARHTNLLLQMLFQNLEQKASRFRVCLCVFALARLLATHLQWYPWKQRWL